MPTKDRIEWSYLALLVAIVLMIAAAAHLLSPWVAYVIFGALWEAWAVAHLAGDVAERKFNGRRSFGGHSDLLHASDLLEYISSSVEQLTPDSGLHTSAHKT